MARFRVRICRSRVSRVMVSRVRLSLDLSNSEPQSYKFMVDTDVNIHKVTTAELISLSTSRYHHCSTIPHQFGVSKQIEIE